MQQETISILLVEDNPDHAELIINELKKDGGLINKIHLAKDGQEALDFLYRKGNYQDTEKAPRPGLILLDLKLPKVDGKEVARRVKSDPDLKNIPIVILTTSTDQEDIARSYANGINSYITKPVKFSEFVRVIQEIKLYWVLTNAGPEPQNV